MSNEFVKLRWFEHPLTGEGHQFVVLKDYDQDEAYPYLVVVMTQSAHGSTGKCVLKYGTQEKRDESFNTYFTEEEMLEFFNELIIASDKMKGKPDRRDTFSEGKWRTENE